jgi:large subunit ribosomal protein L18
MKTLKRRRQEGKTDYGARLAMLKSGKVRLVLRKSNRYIIAQFVQSEMAQDKVIAGSSSRDLLLKGWPKELVGSLKSRAAAYLTGLMLGKLAHGKVSEAILDLGLNRSVNKSRLYAALAGVIDSGIKINHKKDVLPTSEEIKAGKAEKIFDKLKAEVQK